MAIACGLYGLLYLDQEKRAVAAEEAKEKAEAEKKKAEEAAQKANPFLKAGSLDKLRMITKVRGRVSPSIDNPDTEFERPC